MQLQERICVRLLYAYIDSCDMPTGVLACLDGYMNIAIEQTEEYVNGQLKNKYGDAFLRGNNGKKPVGRMIYANHNKKVVDQISCITMNKNTRMFCL